MRTRIANFILGLASVGLTACVHADDDGYGKAEAALDNSAAVDLISPSTCALRNGHLLQCTIAAQALHFDTFETAVPLRTTITSQRAGNCSTQFALEVSLTPPGGTAVPFTYIRGGQTTVRSPGGQPMASLALADSSSWTKYAAFDQSCRISLAFTPNQLDVDSKSDAQAIIDRLTKDLADKQAARDRARELDLYQKAFVFMRNLADNFLGQLTNDQLQDLRVAAQDAQPSLELLITSCSNLTNDQRANLLRLELGLATLGHPEDWQNADGTPKKLGDFLGPSDQQVLATIDQLAHSAGADGGVPPNYDGLYQQAEADYQLALHRLALGRQQLASYLN